MEVREASACNVGCAVQDLPGYMANTQPGIRKLSLDLAAAALKPKAGRPPEQVLAAATQLILSGALPCPACCQAGNVGDAARMHMACRSDLRYCLHKQGGQRGSDYMKIVVGCGLQTTTLCLPIVVLSMQAWLTRMHWCELRPRSI